MLWTFAAVKCLSVKVADERWYVRELQIYPNPNAQDTLSQPELVRRWSACACCPEFMQELDQRAAACGSVMLSLLKTDVDSFFVRSSVIENFC